MIVDSIDDFTIVKKYPTTRSRPYDRDDDDNDGHDDRDNDDDDIYDDDGHDDDSNDGW